MSASLVGLSHLATSVTDMAAGVRFWTEVMGFELVSDEPRFAVLIDRDAHLGVIITDHDGSVAGQQHERPGSDQEPVASPGRARPPERTSDRRRRTIRHTVQPIAYGAEHLQQRGVVQGGLGLDPACAKPGEVGCEARGKNTIRALAEENPVVVGDTHVASTWRSSTPRRN